MVASERYKVDPVRLKLYPAGRTKATIFLGTPNASIFSKAIGNAASELVVENAMVAGSMTVAGSGTVTETDFSSVFRSTATAITTMIMDTAVAAGCIEEQSIPAARIGGAATNSA